MLNYQIGGIFGKVRKAGNIMRVIVGKIKQCVF